MEPNYQSGFDSVRRIFRLYLAVTIAIVVTLGLLHWFWSEVRIGRVYWFNLDKERNIATWFSGVLFFLFGCGAFVAYYWEQRLKAQKQIKFRLPILWWGIGVAGLLMSLDEITILHENLFWREIRHTTAQFGDFWKYVTQWQILFAPAILLLLCYFVLFFWNRFGTSCGARFSALTGIGCWITALLLEGLRETFKNLGAIWYSVQVLAEEMAETLGAICLLAAIIYYVMDIALDSTADRRKRLQPASRFFTRQAFQLLCVTVIILTLSGGAVYYFASQQASAGAPVPRLFRKAQKSQPLTGDAQNTESESLLSLDSAQKVWFEDLKNPLPLSESDQAALMRFVTVSVLNPKNKRTEAIPGILKQDTAPRILFLSVSNGLEPARIFIGTGKGIEAATRQAVSRANSLVPEDFQTKWIKLDIVKDRLARKTANSTEKLELERSLYGLAFDRHSGIAFLPEELVSHSLVNRKQKIRPKNIADYLNRRTGPPDRFHVENFTNKLSMFRFTTNSMFSEGEKVIPLYRGHQIFNQLSKEVLLDAARQGGNYLKNAVRSDGRFVYAYRPKTDKAKDKYNILRHAGTIYSLLELYEVSRQPELLRTVRRPLDYLVQSAQPCKEANDNLVCIVENGVVKLGGNALAVIALAKYTEISREQKYLPLILSLGKWIQSVQRENGEFFVHKKSYPEGKLDDFVSQYYPGEALLALLRIHSLQPDKGWLDSAERGAQYLIDVRDRGLSLAQLSHDHWLLYALNELYRQRPYPLYLKHAGRIARAIIKSQNRNPKYPDWPGSYYRPPRSTPTATRSEGLIAAYLLTRDFGDQQQAKAILESIRLGLAFQLQTQFRPESVMYIKDPQRALGGFHRSLTNFEIRIDYVQHNISSLLGFYRILEDASGYQ